MLATGTIGLSRQNRQYSISPMDEYSKDLIYIYPGISIQYPASSILPIGLKKSISSAFQLPSFQASWLPSLQASLPSPQNILPPLPDGFFLEFMKPRADYGGDV